MKKKIEKLKLEKRDVKEKLKSSQNLLNNFYYKNSNSNKEKN